MGTPKILCLALAFVAASAAQAQSQPTYNFSGGFTKYGALADVSLNFEFAKLGGPHSKLSFGGGPFGTELVRNGSLGLGIGLDFEYTSGPLFVGLGAGAVQIMGEKLTGAGLIQFGWKAKV